MATEAQLAALAKAREAKKRQAPTAARVFQQTQRGHHKLYRPRYLHGFVVDASELPAKGDGNEQGK